MSPHNRINYKVACFIILAVLAGSRRSFAQPAQTPPVYSQWVSLDKNGTLAYKALPRGDRIIDFSYAGYGGGGVGIPKPDVQIFLEPIAGDNTPAIQAAIDQVSNMPLINGFRGAVLLKPGAFECAGTIQIAASGVVLRGSGSGEKGTRLILTGKPHLCVVVKGNVRTSTSGKATFVKDAYVPTGTTSFQVEDGAAFKKGDTIRIIRPVTPAWVHFMGMDSLVRDGKKQTWIIGDITTDRVVREVAANTIKVDLPLTDNYDGAWFNPPGVSVVKINSSGEISQCGIESLRIECQEQSGTINDAHYRAFTMSGVTDAWARDLEIHNTVNSIGVTGRRITIEAVNIIHDRPTQGAAKPADLNGSGQQLLFNRCTITGDNVFYLATGPKVTGPVVLLNCVFNGTGWIQPHQRWATGLLIDNCEVPGGGIDFMNRGIMGSGHGWSIGWAVAWNSKARTFLNQQPPGAANWVIGGFGEPQQKNRPGTTAPLLPEGIYDALGKMVTPGSLYLAQLKERLGNQAVKNIGY